MSFTYNNANYHPAGIAYIGQPIKASKMSDSVKEMLNSIYGANKFYKEATGV